MYGISRRLSTIIDMVTPGKVAADIGCDHGYVAIGLIDEGICERVIACDIKEGPLAAARENIIKAGLSDRVETRLSDGLAAIKPGEADRIVIAGMGGDLIADILRAGLETARAAEELILGPQTKYRLLRAFLSENGFEFVEEDMVEEDGKFYPLIRVSPPKPLRKDESKRYEGDRRGTGLSEAELLYGPLLIRYRHPVLKDYLMRQQRVLIDNRTAASYGQDAARVRELEAELVTIRELLAWMGGADYDG